MSRKKKEQEKEPEYYMSPVGIEVVNYHTYYMKPLEKTLYILLAFAVGAAVAYLFYGGMGVDEYGRATTATYIANAVFMGVTGCIAARLYIPIRRRQIIEKRQKTLKRQFRELLDAISTSIGSGQNVVGAFMAANEDLKLMYTEDDLIVQELQVILHGVNNNIDIEKMLMDFGRRSAVDDIESFASVFETAYRKGGNIKDIIQNTQQILAEKMEIENQIGIIVASNKMEQKIMIVLPIIIVAMIKLMGEDMAKNFVTPVGIASTTIGVAAFVIAYFVGREILDIRI